MLLAACFAKGSDGYGRFSEKHVRHAVVPGENPCRRTHSGCGVTGVRRGVLGGSRVRADTRNIETLTNSQPATAEADSALIGCQRGWVGWGVSEARQAFVTTLAMEC